MGAGALVGIPSHKIIAQKASAGIGYAHGAVDKALYLHILGYVVPDFPDLRQGQLPCRHHPPCPQSMPEQIGPVIGVVGLGAYMDLHVGKNSSGNGEHTRIGYDERIRRHIPHLFKISLHPRQVSVMGQYIGRHVDFDPARMGKGNSLFHLFIGKIMGLGPQAKGLTSDIYGICPVNNGCFQHVQASGRYQ